MPVVNVSVNQLVDHAEQIPTHGKVILWLESPYPERLRLTPVEIGQRLYFPVDVF